MNRLGFFGLDPKQAKIPTAEADMSESIGRTPSGLVNVWVNTLLNSRLETVKPLILQSLAGF